MGQCFGWIYYIFLPGFCSAVGMGSLFVRNVCTHLPAYTSHITDNCSISIHHYKKDKFHSRIGQEGPEGGEV